MRVGLGPVFACERSIASRRWQTYAARSLLLSSLLVAMGTVAASPTISIGGGFARDYAALGESYFYAMIGTQLALVLLAAPAATAGAICVDRARGTLGHVFATDLSDTEIVLGKLAARLAPILALVASTWPVMAISSLLGGIDPIALVLAFAVTMAVAGLGCSLALVLSIWARRMHEVVLVVYVLWALVLLAWPIWYLLSRAGVLLGPERWLLVADPFYLAFAPYAARNQIGALDYLGFFAVVLSATVVSILVAVWRIRPVACRIEGQTQRGARFGLLGRLSRGLPGPSLDRNPVLWREWHRLRPSPWMIGLGFFVWGTTGIACVIGACSVWRHGVNSFPGPSVAQAAGVFAYLILILFGLLMLSAVAPTSVSEERQRGSLDVLVATPLSTTAILLGKWWGTFRLVPFLAIGPGLMALALATGRVIVHPRPVIGTVILPETKDLSMGMRLGAAALLVATILTYGAALTSLGLALATWIKRQSRAIAASVSIFVIVAIGWPILTMSGPARGAFGARALSPIFSVGGLGEELMMRSDRLGSTMWSVGLWDVSAAALAIGVCWLTARTFDDAFGRVPERPRKSHWMADVAVVVAGVTAAACLVNGVASWVQGVNPRQFPDGQSGTTVIVLELVGLVLVSLLAALSTPHEGALSRPEEGDSKARSSVAIVVGRWWHVFRVALLLAVAPGLIVLALATARDFQPVIGMEDTTIGPAGTKAVMITYTTPSGETSRRMYAGDRSDANVQAALRELSAEHARQPLGDRLRIAGLVMITILVHGAAATSAGVALAIWVKRRRWRIAAAVCVTLLVALGWPVCVYFVSAAGFNVRDGAYALSPLWAAGYLMEMLINREAHASGLLWLILAWDGVAMMFAIGVLYLAVRALVRRLGAVNVGSLPIPRPAVAQRLLRAERR
jgi:ABC-type transport system involved in multi-copper enzyme maturation permease subunit